MGEQQVRSRAESEARRRITLALLEDLAALEHMIDAGSVEDDARRIGAEQEVFLVDSAWRPSPTAVEILERLESPRFTTELGRYNLEINLDPVPYGGACLSAMLEALERDLDRLREAAAELGVRVVLAGMLPTLRKSDLGLENMTPRPRYRALNDAMNALRGGPWRLQIRGLEELSSKHDNVMLESCCTSFQAHLQVAPEEFARAYNIAQAVTAPILAAAANSAILFGQRLWHETRIPVFQQSIDTRRTGDSLREAAPRVRFGERWVDDSILELFREDVVRFRVLLDREVDPDPFAALAAGGVPKLEALQLHNGTVYRWNRGCYGISAGRPHVRIEARALPSGPSAQDEVANAALFYGLVMGFLERGSDMRRLLRFDDARGNFQAAAQRGLDAQFVWFGRTRVAATDLLLQELIPTAREGLEATGVDEADGKRFLDLIEQRVRSGVNGARWQLGSSVRLAGKATRQQIATALTASMVANQEVRRPIHEWSWATLDRGQTMSVRELRVEEIMSRDVHTIGPDEPIELAGKIMDWKVIRHLPVEDADQRLVGLVTVLHVMQELARRPREAGRAVREIMRPDPPFISPELPIGVALQLMTEQEADALPVVDKGRVVGIVTERDFVQVVARLLA